MKWGFWSEVEPKTGGEVLTTGGSSTSTLLVSVWGEVRGLKSRETVTVVRKFIVWWVSSRPSTSLESFYGRIWDHNFCLRNVPWGYQWIDDRGHQYLHTIGWLVVRDRETERVCVNVCVCVLEQRIKSLSDESLFGSPYVVHVLTL